MRLQRRLSVLVVQQTQKEYVAANKENFEGVFTNEKVEQIKGKRVGNVGELGGFFFCRFQKYQSTLTELSNATFFLWSLGMTLFDDALPFVKELHFSLMLS